MSKKGRIRRATAKKAKVTRKFPRLRGLKIHKIEKLSVFSVLSVATRRHTTLFYTLFNSRASIVERAERERQHAGRRGAYSVHSAAQRGFDVPSAFWCITGPGGYALWMHILQKVCTLHVISDLVGSYFM